MESNNTWENTQLTGRTLLEASAGSGKTYTVALLYLRAILGINTPQGRPLKVSEILVVTFTNAATEELQARIRQRIKEAINHIHGDKGDNDIEKLINLARSLGITNDNCLALLNVALGEMSLSKISTIHGFCSEISNQFAVTSGLPFPLTLSIDDAYIKTSLKDLWRYNIEKDKPADYKKKELNYNSHEKLFAKVVNKHDAPIVKAPPYIEENYQRLTSWLSAWEDKTGNFYSDRLLNRAASLSGQTGVAAKIRAALPLAIIDEFQDTDSAQYRLFDNIYRGNDCGLLMVGDPKQAIYRFRGGDVYTYLQAKEDVKKPSAGTGELQSLTDNYRSTAQLVEGLNLFFQEVCKEEHKNHVKGPFQLGEEIKYENVTPKGKAEPIEVLTSGSELSKLKAIDCIYLEENQQGELKAAELKDEIAKKSARYVEKLLRVGRQRQSSGETQDSQPEKLAPSDIALLVNSHNEATLMQRALGKVNIASLIKSNASLYLEQEAYDCWVIIKYLLQPENLRLLRNALATSVSGLNAMELERVLSNDHLRLKCVEKAYELRDVLNNKGPLSAVLSWLQLTGAINHLTRPDGERRAANLIHLLETLQEEYERIGGGDALAVFLERKIQDQSNDESTLRLESDDDRVIISTIHAAKGLEYPVVVVPFAWDGKTQNIFDKIFDFHEKKETAKEKHADDEENEATNNNPQQLLLGIEKEHIENQREEQTQERQRLFYVAVTRAKQHLALMVIDPNSGKDGKEIRSTFNKSPLGWYFPLKDSETNCEKAIERLKQTLEPANKGCVALNDVPDCHGTENTTAQKDESSFASVPFTGQVNNRLGTTSFSALTRGYYSGVKDDDQDTSSAEDTSDAVGRFALPRGANIGTALHNVLEQTDFSLWREHENKAGISLAKDKLKQALTQELKAYGLWQVTDDFDTTFECYQTWMADVINAPLTSEQGSPLALSTLTHWFPELEFTFSLADTFGKIKLRDLLKTLGYGVDGLAGASVYGMLTGAIDLVFEHDGRYYIADYKSNHLGDAFASYGESALQKNINEKAYNLQFLIYSLALHKHLASRIPNYEYDKHFGGVFYLYLRGMTTQADLRGNGVFYHRPDFKVIDQLDQLLCVQQPERVA